jgi:ATP-binding cassette subfamily B protein
MKSLNEASKELGFETLASKVSFAQLNNVVSLPCIAHWNQNHFVVIYKVNNTKVFISDPGIGLISYSHEEFKKHWLDIASGTGIVLMLEKNGPFKIYPETKKKSELHFISKYFLKQRKSLIALCWAMFLICLIQLAAPFLTQMLVDKGINRKDINFVYLMLGGQLSLLIGRYTFEFLRDRLSIYISARLNIRLILDFLDKLMRLPFSYFESKVTGDLIQRIADHSRIENFFSAITLGTMFSFLTVLVYGGLLIYYDPVIFLVFLLTSLLYVTYVTQFMKSRKRLDYKKFQSLSENQDTLVQMINGMAEIKINNWQVHKREKWHSIQKHLFNLNVSSLKVAQYQIGGSSMIREIGNIVMSIMAAKAVIDGSISLGVMLAIQYMIGQLNAPLNSFVQFTSQIQDAMLSLARINEVHSLKDEIGSEKISENEIQSDLVFSNVSFRYPGTEKLVLNNISLTIPFGKRVAIVGASGCGKTTLLKLILKFYNPQYGQLICGGKVLTDVEVDSWRERCGAVMQNGFIFSDTIVGNIAGSENYDKEKFWSSIRGANLEDFVNGLPMKENSKVGSDGSGVSGGQKQRLLIARALYKDPQILLFDEATSSLDAMNETAVMDYIYNELHEKTIVIVAHRLSTVKNADLIYFLEQGQVAEQGTHQELIRKKGRYYGLIKNQLELGE